MAKRLAINTRFGETDWKLSVDQPDYSEQNGVSV